MTARTSATTASTFSAAELAERTVHRRAVEAILWGIPMVMPFFDTKAKGPMVLEIPPADGGSITGTIMDSWQMALEDVGPPAPTRAKVAST
jgi:hypothetical protein